MSKVKRFSQRYKSGDTPWDLGRADYNLSEMVVNWPILPCKALELGCGTGDNAIWLAKHNFIVTAFDLISVAVDMAKIKAIDTGVKIDFYVADILKDTIPNNPFNFIFDRGVFHIIDDDSERILFAKNVASHLAENGLWLSLIGCKDQAREGSGPPLRSAREIINATEPFFEIQLLKVSQFDSKAKDPAKIWVYLMKKRKSNL